MKCPNCGAEGNGKYCEYCGSEMPNQQPTINVVNYYYTDDKTASANQGGRTTQNRGGANCPRCKENSVSFHRELSGTRGVHQTVGVCKNCGHTWVSSRDVIASDKNKIVALVLCILGGYFGLHCFYVGKVGMGIVYLFTMGLFGIGWIIDLIRLATGTYTDAHGYQLK